MLNKRLLLKIDLKTIMAYIVVFFSIFGPKFFGVLDISIILNVLIIGVYMCLGKANIRQYSSVLLELVIVIVTYALIICLVSHNLNFIFIAKFIRVGTCILALGLYINDAKLTKMELVNILINILLVHAIIVIISATVFVEFQNVLKPFTGFRLPANRFRATGLTNGFDFSGLLCVFGVLLVGLYPNKLVIKKRLSKLFIFIGASLLTSRITMLVLELTIIYMALMNKRLNKKVKGLLIMILLVSLLPVMGIFLFSTGNYDNVVVKLLLNIPYFSKIAGKLVYYYANTNIGNTISEHYSLSRLSSFQIFFGAMEEANQDPGYTQYIYYIGILGLIIVLFFYVMLVFYARRRKNSTFIADKYLFKILFACVGLCLCLSIKNSYLMARHVTEVILILTNLLYKKDVNNKED